MIKIKAKVLTSFWEKTKGLIGVKKIYPVYFKTRLGIHTFGMKSKIDVVILDKASKVVKMAQNLLPNRFFFWSPKFNKVLELPPGEVKKQRIKIGERITW